MTTDDDPGAVLNDLALNIGFLATKFSWAAIRAANEALEEFGLRTRPYALLELSRSDGGVAQRELGRLMNLDPSAIVALISELERQKLVSREPDPRDRRNRIVAATPAGRALAMAATQAVERSQASLLAGLGEPERRQLQESLLVVAMGNPSP